MYQIINISDASYPSRKLIKDSDSIFAATYILVLPGCNQFTLYPIHPKLLTLDMSLKAPAAAPRAAPYLPWQHPAH